MILYLSKTLITKQLHHIFYIIYPAFGNFMEKTTTLILGASTNEARYSYKAAHHLAAKGYKFALLGVQQGEVLGQPILNDFPDFSDIDTVTLYVNPTRQAEYYDYILGLNPRRIIFNPGTENADFVAIAQAKGIICDYACTLVLLATETY